MTPIPFRAEHILDLSEVQDVQLDDLAAGLAGGGDEALQHFVQIERSAGMNYSILDDENRLVGCGGVFSLWPQRAASWSIAVDGWHERVNVRKLKRFICSILDGFPARRIEATVLHDFEPGHRWVRALGFRMEAERMKCYDPAGRDFALYARLRE